MEKHIANFPSGKTELIFGGNLSQTLHIQEYGVENIFVITDNNVFELYPEIAHTFKHVIVIPSGESHKHLQTVQDIIIQLIKQRADRNAFILGIGGGVVTDMAGFAASIFLRGVKFGFVPTTVLAMVDACIGGKNGVDCGIYKNMIGVFNQPKILLYDYSLLRNLPKEQISNGFAEIIKHAAILDAEMFNWLNNHDITEFEGNSYALWEEIIPQNARLKANLVEQDEQEQNIRKYLNFGHTLGHAIENDLLLLHGHAVSIGCVFAAWLSQKYFDFNGLNAIITLFKQYNLPIYTHFEIERVMQNFWADKKRKGNSINYVLLSKIGKAEIVSIEINQLKIHLEEYQLFIEKHSL